MPSVNRRSRSDASKFEMLGTRELIFLVLGKWVLAIRHPPRPCSLRCAVSSPKRPWDGVQESVTDHFNAKLKWLPRPMKNIRRSPANLRDFTGCAWSAGLKSQQ